MKTTFFCPNKNKQLKDKLFFENLTLAPIEKDLINYKLLNRNETDLVPNNYVVASEQFELQSSSLVAKSTISKDAISQN